jgi:hypothetical protein
MFEKILTLFTLAAAIGLSLLLQSTTPTESGPITILTILFFVYVICTGILTWIIVIVSRMYIIAQSKFGKRVVARSDPIKRAYYYASFIAFAPVMLLGLRSIGASSFPEVLPVLIFVAIGVFYTRKRID